MASLQSAINTATGQPCALCNETAYPMVVVFDGYSYIVSACANNTGNACRVQLMGTFNANAILLDTPQKIFEMP